MRDRLARARRPDPAEDRWAVVDGIASRVEGGPRDGRRRRLPRRLARRLLLRLIKPFTVYQRDVDVQAVNALRELAQHVETLRAEQLRSETERLRQARQAAREPDLRPQLARALERIDELTSIVEGPASTGVVPIRRAPMEAPELELTSPSAESDVFVVTKVSDGNAGP